MEIGQLVWFFWWKGHFPNADGQSDLIRNNRRLIVDEVKLEKINRGEE